MVFILKTAARSRSALALISGVAPAPTFSSTLRASSGCFNCSSNSPPSRRAGANTSSLACGRFRSLRFASNAASRSGFVEMEIRLGENRVAFHWVVRLVDGGLEPANDFLRLFLSVETGNGEAVLQMSAVAIREFSLFPPLPGARGPAPIVPTPWRLPPWPLAASKRCRGASPPRRPHRDTLSFSSRTLSANLAGPDAVASRIVEQAPRLLQIAANGRRGLMRRQKGADQTQPRQGRRRPERRPAPAIDRAGGLGAGFSTGVAGSVLPAMTLPRPFIGRRRLVENRTTSAKRAACHKSRSGCQDARGTLSPPNSFVTTTTSQF